MHYDEGIPLGILPSPVRSVYFLSKRGLVRDRLCRKIDSQRDQRSWRKIIHASGWTCEQHHKKQDTCLISFFCCPFAATPHPCSHYTTRVGEAVFYKGCACTRALHVLILLASRATGPQSKADLFPLVNQNIWYTNFDL